jgi:hypothetical protein
LAAASAMQCTGRASGWVGVVLGQGHCLGKSSINTPRPLSEFGYGMQGRPTAQIVTRYTGDVLTEKLHVGRDVRDVPRKKSGQSMVGSGMDQPGKSCFVAFGGILQLHSMCIDTAVALLRAFHPILRNRPKKTQHLRPNTVSCFFEMCGFVRGVPPVIFLDFFSFSPLSPHTPDPRGSSVVASPRRLMTGGCSLKRGGAGLKKGHRQLPGGRIRGPGRHEMEP